MNLRAPTVVRYGILVGLCVVVRVAWWLTFQPWADDYAQRMTIGGDPKAYMHFAENLFHGMGYRWLSEDFLDDFPFWRWRYGEYEAIWMPGYPTFLAGVMLLSGGSIHALIVAQIFCSALACALLIRAGEILHTPRLGTLIGVAFSMDPLLVNLSLILLSESVYLLCLAVWVYSMAHIIASRTSPALWGWLGLSAVSLAASVWVRVGTIALAPLVAFGMIWLFRQRAVPVKNALLMVALWTTLFYVLLLPWYIRNYQIYRTWSLSCIGSFSLLAGLSFRVPAAERYEEYRNLFVAAESQARAEGRSPETLNPFERARYWRQVAIREYRADWRGALYAHLKRMAATLLFSDYANWRRFSGNEENASLLTRFAWGWFAAWHLLFLGAVMVGIGKTVRRAIPEPLRLYTIGALAVAALSIFIIVNNAEPRGRVTAVVSCLPAVALVALELHPKRHK